MKNMTSEIRQNTPKFSYEQGKVYKLWRLDTNEIYIGSTCGPLYKRLGQHKQNYKKYLNGKYRFTTSFKLFEKGLDDVLIELIENVPCSNKAELERAEGYHIRSNVCLNKHIPTRSLEEIISDRKNERVSCSCGGRFTRAHKAEHEKPKKHQQERRETKETPK